MKSIASAAIAAARLEPAPIRPEWIRGGTPEARMAELSRSADGAALTAVWDCTAGEFDWSFGGDEWVHILEGEVEVEDGSGRRTLRPGDVALFHAGTTARWRVPVYVKKLAFCRETVPGPVLKAVSLARRLKAALARRAQAANPFAASVILVGMTLPA